MKAILPATQLLLVGTIVAALALWTVGGVHGKASDNAAYEASVMQFRNTCRKKANLSDADFKVIQDHQLFTPTTTASSVAASLKCYTLCFLHEAGIFKDNAMNEALLRQMLPSMISDASKINAAIDKCGQLSGANNCEKAFNFELCLIKETGLYVY